MKFYLISILILVSFVTYWWLLLLVLRWIDTCENLDYQPIAISYSSFVWMYLILAMYEGSYDNSLTVSIVIFCQNAHGCFDFNVIKINDNVTKCDMGKKVTIGIHHGELLNPLTFWQISFVWHHISYSSRIHIRINSKVLCLLQTKPMNKAPTKLLRSNFTTLFTLNVLKIILISKEFFCHSQLEIFTAS